MWSHEPDDRGPGGRVAGTLDEARTRVDFLVLGIGASFVAAFGLALFLELVDPVVINAQQLENIAERPVLGSLPRLG